MKNQIKNKNNFYYLENFSENLFKSKFKNLKLKSRIKSLKSLKNTKNLKEKILYKKLVSFLYLEKIQNINFILQKKKSFSFIKNIKRKKLFANSQQKLHKILHFLSKLDLSKKSIKTSTLYPLREERGEGFQSIFTKKNLREKKSRYFIKVFTKINFLYNQNLSQNLINFWTMINKKKEKSIKFKFIENKTNSLNFLDKRKIILKKNLQTKTLNKNPFTKNFFRRENYSLQKYIMSKLFLNSKEFKNDFNNENINLSFLVKKAKNSKFMLTLDEIKNDFSKKQIIYRKFSKFKQQLKERKKLSLIYGYFPLKHLEKLCYKAFKLNGKFDDNFFFLIEKRLDFILYRIGFFFNIKTARQFISHKKILVNGKIVDIPSFYVKRGDIISIKFSEINKLQKLNIFTIKKYIFLNKNKDYLARIENFCFFLNFFDIYYLLDKRKNKNLFFLKNYFQKNLDNLREGQKNTEFLINYFLVNFFSKNQSSFAKEDISSKIHEFLFLKSKKFLKIESFINFLENSSTKYKNFYNFLKLKKIIYKEKNLRLKKSFIYDNKPLNMEISYRYCTAIYMFSPQKLKFPASIDFHKILRSIILKK